MKRFLKFGTIVAAVIMLCGAFLVPQIADSRGPRDCDGNAVIYCGAWSTTELNNLVKNGTGKPNQSGAELTSLFKRYGYTTSDAGNLKSGRVTNDNKVYLGNKVIATNVYSMGRHYINGSFDVKGINYPLWFRHPGASFRSTSLDAFILLNYDGSFRLAIIKSCGNIVPGVVKNAPQRVYLEIRKWNDLNGDNHRQVAEPYLSGWQFRVVGPETNTTVTTDATGSVYLRDLPTGTYTIDEIPQDGWRNITPTHRVITLTSGLTVFFGNQRIPEQRTRLEVVKYNDVDGNGTREAGEDLLSGWTFTVSGPNGYQNTLVTDASGRAELTNLALGQYTVTEVERTGWRNTTGLNITRNVTLDPATQTFVFGNQRVPEQEELSIEVVKFNDANGNKTRESNEGTLAGWTFLVSGPNGYQNTIVTDANGRAELTGLEAGHYVVAEVNKAGWRNTTGLTIARDVTLEDPDTQVFVFGNQKIKTPPKVAGKGHVLPVSGPLNEALPFAGAFTLSGGVVAWIRSKKELLSLLRK